MHLRHFSALWFSCHFNFTFKSLLTNLLSLTAFPFLRLEISCFSHYIKSVASYHASQNSTPQELLIVFLVWSIQLSSKHFGGFIMFVQLHAQSRIWFIAHYHLVNCHSFRALRVPLLIWKTTYYFSFQWTFLLLFSLFCSAPAASFTSHRNVFATSHYPPREISVPLVAWLPDVSLVPWEICEVFCFLER